MSGPRIGSLFSGYSGLEMGVQAVLGGHAVWHSEIDPGACKILAHRYPDVPNLGDITAVDWSQVEPVDVLTGGFPCTDVSCAGLRQGLTPDTRSGLWTQMAYAIDKLRPPLVVIENVRGLLSAHAEHPAHRDHFHPVHGAVEPCPWCVGDGSDRPLRALGAVLGDLADIGYDASWHGLRAADVGAPHGRFRVFVVAWPAADTEPRGRQAVAVDGTPLGARGRLEGEEPEARRAALAVADGGRELAPPPHAADDGRERGRPPRHGRDGSADHGDAAADADRHGWPGWAEADRLERAHGSGSRRAAPRPGADTAPDTNLAGLEGREPAAGHELPAWGPYGDAIRRWERCLGRPAPAPTERGSKGQPRLSPAFVEWMMGLPAGWVTDVPGLGRNEQLKALGNGVVPQQAVHALRLLLPDVQALEVAA